MKTLLIACLLTAAPAFAQDAGTEDVPPDVSKLPFSPDSIKLVIAHHQPKIQACYEEMLAGMKKPIEGKLMTSFVITGEGLVKGPKIVKKGTTLRDGKLYDCVAVVLAGMNFPKTRDGRDQPIEYPFNLKAIK